MRSDVQTVRMGEQLEGVRIGDGHRRHIGHGQRRQHAINDVQNLGATTTQNKRSLQTHCNANN